MPYPIFFDNQTYIGKASKMIEDAMKNDKGNNVKAKKTLAYNPNSIKSKMEIELTRK